jgi:NDP-sugar pyrophosphorylase family protein
MEKAALLVLAAGMGSRYGGLKQLDGVGPGGETIMDYSVYDALDAGFGKVVFVIRHSFEEDFRRKIVSRYEKHIAVELVYQELESLPAGYSLPAGRVKPWGTNHAILMAKDTIRTPFAVINADDFYGRESFGLLAAELNGMEGEAGKYCMVAYQLGRTLSEHGSVSRGVCEVSPEGYLTGIVERTAITQTGTGESETPVSMNMWGLTPDYFDHSERYFIEFLQSHILDLKSEYFIPTMVNHLLETRKACVKVLRTSSQWFGVTYPEDRPAVEARLRGLVEAGVYPSPLFV